MARRHFASDVRDGHGHDAEGEEEGDGGVGEAGIHVGAEAGDFSGSHLRFPPPPPLPLLQPPPLMESSIECPQSCDYMYALQLAL